jgi:hypothetical protein
VTSPYGFSVYPRWYRLINDEYIGARGLTTVEQVIPIYAPSDDNNDVPGYISAISVLVGQWRKGE